MHALSWSGSAGSCVDLNPIGAIASEALGVGGGQEVGSADFSPGDHHAMLWIGTAASAVDLNSAGFAQSRALATSAGREAGWGYLQGTASSPHALLWSGSAASLIDLHLLLPAGQFTSSDATTIDAAGNIWGVGTTR